jgi:hypothetical protein
LPVPLVERPVPHAVHGLPMPPAEYVPMGQRPHDAPPYPAEQSALHRRE